MPGLNDFRSLIMTQVEDAEPAIVRSRTYRDRPGHSRLGALLGVALTSGLTWAPVMACADPAMPAATPHVEAPTAAPPPTTSPAPPGTASADLSITLPPPPDAGNPTPEHVAEARKLILSTGISRSFAIMVGEFMDQIGNTYVQARPDLVRDMNLVLEQLKPEFDRQSDEMIDRSARIYASLLSEKDIDTILAFYNSEAGRRYVALQPLFLNQLLSGTQAWQQKIAINMMARVRAEMKKKGHDL